jgi:RNA polymerase-binding transcription factor DksA
VRRPVRVHAVDAPGHHTRVPGVVSTGTVCPPTVSWMPSLVAMATRVVDPAVRASGGDRAGGVVARTAAGGDQGHGGEEETGATATGYPGGRRRLARMETDLARQRLMEEKDRLDGVRSTFDGEGDQSEAESLGELSSYDQHQADVGTETFEREKDLSILEQVEAELADVEHALRRLDDGTYGRCEVCGKAIPDERLEAMPATRLCVAHQAEAEREVRVSGGRDAG